MYLNPLKKYTYTEFDHEFASPSCDPNIHTNGYNMIVGENSIMKSCLFGKDHIEHCLDYGKDYAGSDGKIKTNGLVRDSDGNVIYYADSNGVLKGGLIEAEDGNKYIFDDSSEIPYLYTNSEVYYNGDYYYVNENGIVQEGLIVNEYGNIYYANEAGVLQNGFVKLDDGTIYFFTSNIAVKNEEICYNDGYYYAGEDGIIKTGWITTYNEYSYYDEEEQSWIDGIDEYIHYADEDGRYVEGFQEIDGKNYYFDHYMYKSEVINYNGEYYYAGEDGIVQTGLIRAENGDIYYANEEGVLQRGLVETENGDRYFFEDYEYSVPCAKKEQEIYYNNDYYYAGEDGVIQTGWITIGYEYDYYDEEKNEWKTTYDEYTCYADENGRYVEGLKEINGNKYYFNHSLYKNDVINYNGEYYYAGEDGIIQTGLIEDENGNIYYADENGVLQRGLIEVENGDKYYFEEDMYNTPYAYKKVIAYWNDNYYYAGEDGIIQNGLIIVYYDYYDEDGNLYQEEETYYTDEYSRLLTGFQEIDGNTYYFDLSALKGLQYIDGYDYFFNENGILQKNKIVKRWTDSRGNMYIGENGYREYVEGLITVDGNTYLFDYWNPDGLFGRQEYDGDYYYFDEETGIMQKGRAIETSRKVYYYDDSTGKMLKGKFVTIDGKLYYFGATSGALQKTGWYTKNGNKYYLDKKTGEAAVGLKIIDNDTYYFNEEGVMQTGTIKIAGKKYYFDEKGKKVVGMVTIEGKTYYYQEEGNIAMGKFITVDGKLYYFGATSGTLQKTGWYTKNGNKYYFDKTTGEVAVGLKEIDGNTYYFSNSGVIQKNITFSIDGVDYYTNENGIVFQVEQAKEQIKYYYDQLDEGAKIIYDELVNNIDSFKAGTQKIELSTELSDYTNKVGGLSYLNDAFQSACDAFNNDNIDYFFIDTTKITMGISYSTVGGTTTYKFSFKKGSNDNYFRTGFDTLTDVENAYNAVIEKENEIMSSIDAKDDYNIVLAVHDWLVDNLEYDYTFSTNCHNVYGALIESKPVCEGYSKAFKSILDKYYIPCIVVSGYAESDGNGGAHAWNYVQLDGEWYVVDVTWDDPTINSTGSGPDYEAWLKKIKYTYFLTGSSDEAYVSTHTDDSQLGGSFDYPELANNNYIQAA